LSFSLTRKGPRSVLDASPRGTAGTRPGGARGVGAVSQPARQTGRVRPARREHPDHPDPQRYRHPPRRRTEDATV